MIASATMISSRVKPRAGCSAAASLAALAALALTQQVALAVQPVGTPVVARWPFWSMVKTKPRAAFLPVAVTR